MTQQLALDSVEEAIKEIAGSEMVVVVDDDDREYQCGLIAAAAKITPEQMAFRVRHPAGLVCAPLPACEAGPRFCAWRRGRGEPPAR